jgi:Mg-chelatase subunit ChlD
MLRFYRSFVAAGFALVCTLAGQGVTQAPAVFRTGPVYAARFPTLEIVLEATPPAGTSGGDLVFRPAELMLTEDGVETGPATGLRTFDQTGEGVAVMLALDASGSMRGKPLQAVRDGLGEFVAKARPYDRMSVQTFADDARLEANWSTPPAEVLQHIENIQVRGQYTRLWDALDTALTELESKDLPARRRLVVISDGHDEGSSKTLADVISHAARLRVPVDSIGVTRSNPVYLGNLASLSQSTSGQYRQAPDTDALKQLVGSGIDRLLHSPAATFKAKRMKADGGVHRLGVRWKATNQIDQEPVFIARKNPAWLPVWFEWWQGAVAGVVLAAALLFVWKKRKPTGALPPPLAVPSAAPVAHVSPVTHPPITMEPISRPATELEETRLQTETPAIAAASPQRSKTQFAAAFAAPSTENPAAYLRGVRGPGEGKQIRIDRQAFWIGSAPNNHFCADFDPGVSGNHLCIRSEGSTLKIYDNQSTNNTWVNRQAVGDTARLLNPGDSIQFGQTVYVLETHPPTQLRQP